MYQKYMLLKVKKNSFKFTIEPSTMSIVFAYFKHLKLPISISTTNCLEFHDRERSGSVVECMIQDRRVVGSSLTCVTA